MNNYSELIQSISVGTNTHYANDNLTRLQAEVLLKKTIEILNLTALNNNCWENNKYFVYIGKFPIFHVAIDNKAGTTRLYSITTENEIPNA